MKSEYCGRTEKKAKPDEFVIGLGLEQGNKKPAINKGTAAKRPEEEAFDKIGNYYVENREKEEAAAKAAANKEKDLPGAKDVDKLAQNERNKRMNPIQRGRQMVSDNIAKAAGVSEDVFAKIDREYLESLRRKEEKEEERWKDFGEFFAKESSATTKNQSSKFTLGTKNEATGGKIMGIGDLIAEKAGWQEGVDLIEKRKAEKEYERSRRNKEDNFFPQKAQSTISEEEFIRLLQLDEAKAQKEILKTFSLGLKQRAERLLVSRRCLSMG